MCSRDAERNLLMNQAVINFGPLDGQVDRVTGYLVTVTFAELHVSLKRNTLGKKKTQLSTLGQ